MATLCLLFLLWQPAAAVAPAEVHFPGGVPLTDALLTLQRRGLRLVFSSTVVKPAMRVESDVRSRDLRELLDDILAPHGLAVAERHGVLVVIRKTVKPPRQPVRPPGPVWSEEIVVQPSRISLLADEPLAPISLDRDEIQALPHLGDDVFRTLRFLPGTTSSDLSAELSLRGGRRDEMLVRLDGQELYDPYHLKEYDNALSIISASALANADLITAGLPVSYGDRMGGVLDMVTIAPPVERRIHLVASIVGMQLEAGDSFRDGRIGWFVSGRRGNTDLLGRAFHIEGPGFWDAFEKIEASLSPRQSIGLRVLTSADRLSFTLPGSKELRTDYSNSYVWLTHRGSNGRTWFVDTSASVGHVERDRRGFETDEERTFDVRDERRLSISSLVQSWTLYAAPKHFINAGFEVRRFDADYDYSNGYTFETPLAAIRVGPASGVYRASTRRGDEQFSVFVSDGIHLLDSLTVDAGARYDRHTSTGDSGVSPRLNAAWAVAPNTVLRLSCGRFLQSQRVNELMIEDGDVRLYPTERSTQWVAGVEHLFPPSSPVPLTSVRVEAYRRRVSNPRPRYENLLGPFDPFPEGEFDRVRIEPDRATAEGLEILVQGRPTARVNWFVNYTLASTKDRLNGAEIPRSIDQRHTLNVDVNRRIGNDWNVNLAWVFRTGHPTTRISVTPRRDAEGDIEYVPVLGRLNGERLPGYHRLDARLSREWRHRSGVLTFFVDAQNVYDRANVSGLDVKLDEDSGILTKNPEVWPLFFASAGISWEFN